MNGSSATGFVDAIQAHAFHPGAREVEVVVSPEQGLQAQQLASEPFQFARADGGEAIGLIVQRLNSLDIRARNPPRVCTGRSRSGATSGDTHVERRRATHYR